MLKYTTRKFAALAMVGSGLLTSCNALDATTAVVGRKSNAGVNGGERVILQCRTDCSELATAITAQGGRVVYRFQNVAALTAEIPPGASGKILSLPAVKASAKDYLLTVPPAQRDARRESGATVERKRSANLIVRATANNYNTLGTGIEQLHTQGYTGKDVIVAVIDSGIANNPKKVPALAGSVIGGENFVSLPSEPSATSTLNDPHGTEVSSLIAGHAIVSLPGDDPLSLAMAAHAPESVSLSDSAIDIPVIGMAPEAKLYAIKVFPANGDGTPSSIVLMGMDRALTLKRNFNTGGSKRPVSGRGTEDSPYVYDALNIQVVNLSLGGDALFPGFEVDDLLVTEMLNNGIVVAVSAGNEGPANLTIGSPAAGFGALSVGAVNLAIHDRVRGELRLGPGQGSLFRPTTYTQLASFSSRGPLPDGRDGVHLVSNGVGLVMQGASGAMALASGTSYSAPLVAGAAATLIAAVPTANSQQVRSALVEGADPG
ncbi:MAG: S8 family serine peptidase, partial [Gammaproteobacteria bacterium]|nr:S8 family serine peptidase [Gammaproteobacteria bacterium]